MSDLGAVMALERGVEEAPHWNEEEYASTIRDEPGVVRRLLVIAEHAGELVGLAVGKVIDTGASAVAELESVVVAQEARRMGVGRALCEEVIAWARGEGAVDVELEVRSANAPARALYRNLGFVEVGVRKRYYHSPGDDAVLMNLNMA
ncbi:GNAT family N-acetyltransferase [Edaphobacter albus]|uniref:GNAT family N-acetyltransferase n=1 Tax=Edaphobacter sp. 4G125 TaxID=2763071 RepID=UPI0016483231|nr:GNAT family N-acetyltransferase [Edaphobacter sp. 4G125]QNI35891.1 GNAT family N-acetyltransferase [Edaphobacter sp. 4G125]